MSGTSACTSGSDEVKKITATSRSTDVYAMGIIFYEIVTRQIPFPTVDNEFKLARLVTRGRRPPLSDLPEGTPVTV